MKYEAVSNKPVGVDIEPICGKERADRMKDKILYSGEQFDNVIEFLTLWTKKEAYFKFSNDEHFIPNQINTLLINNSVTQLVKINSEDFVCSVVGEEIEKFKIITF